MRARSFSHVGITVSDFNAAVRFYWEVFGCPLVGVADTPPDRVRAFFGVDAPAPRCKIGWILAPGGGVLEIFAFEPKQPPIAIPWNRVGLTHISFNVRNLPRWYDYLVSRGVECVSKPERSPRGHSFFFVKDFDGNLIELMDLGYMYYVLGWLGPLGGWLFRRGMYRQYYQEAGSRNQEAGSRKQGAGSRKQGAGSRKQEAGSRKQEAGSREQGAGSRNQEARLGQSGGDRRRNQPAAAGTSRTDPDSNSRLPKTLTSSFFVGSWELAWMDQGTGT